MKNTLFITPILENVTSDSSTFVFSPPRPGIHFRMPPEISGLHHDDITAIIHDEEVVWDYSYFYKLAQRITNLKQSGNPAVLLMRKDVTYELAHQKTKFRFRDYLIGTLVPQHFADIRVLHPKPNEPLSNTHQLVSGINDALLIRNVRHAYYTKPDPVPRPPIQGTIYF